MHPTIESTDEATEINAAPKTEPRTEPRTATQQAPDDKQIRIYIVNDAAHLLLKLSNNQRLTADQKFIIAEVISTLAMDLMDVITDNGTRADFRQCVIEATNRYIEGIKGSHGDNDEGIKLL